jgi:membrane protein required for beta-lactamase induction
MASNGGIGTPAVTMAVYAALVYDVISATNSSPQTTEINARKRAETLMKWVHVGLAQAAIFAVLGIALEVKAHRPAWPPALGSGMAASMLYVQYVYARNSGISKPGPETEEY